MEDDEGASVLKVSLIFFFLKLIATTIPILSGAYQ